MGPACPSAPFLRIKSKSLEDLDAWKRTFPDPVNSPGHHTRSLTVSCLRFINAADAEAGGWIRAFSNVVVLEVRSATRSSHESMNNLVPFRNFSPALKSLSVEFGNISLSEVFGLICTLPLLEDLTTLCHVVDTRSSSDQRFIFQPSTSPALTGTLLLYITGMECTAGRFLVLPNGLYFRKIVCTWVFEEALVEGCSDTPECIEIGCSLPRTFLLLLHWANHQTQLCFIREFMGDFDRPHAKATKLKEVVFRFNTGARLIDMALETITSKHRDLQQISVYIPSSSLPLGDPVDVRRILGEEIARSG